MLFILDALITHRRIRIQKIKLLPVKHSFMCWKCEFYAKLVLSQLWGIQNVNNLTYWKRSFKEQKVKQTTERSKQNINFFQISSEVIGAISAVTAILISVGIVVLIVLKHKSSQVEREYKRIQIQMDLVRITLTFIIRVNLS